MLVPIRCFIPIFWEKWYLANDYSSPSLPLPFVSRMHSRTATKHASRCECICFAQQRFLFDYVNGAINYAGCLSSQHDATRNEIDTRLASRRFANLYESRGDFTFASLSSTYIWTLLIKVNLRVNSLETHDLKIVFKSFNFKNF